MDLMRSLPLGLYLESPITWLHRLDPRVKLGWLVSFLLVPLLANIPLRVAIVAILILLTAASKVPWRVWKQQVGWLMLLCVYISVLILFIPDGLNANHQGRLPAREQQFNQQPTALELPKLQRPWYNPFMQVAKPEPELPPEKLKQPTNYRYFIFQRGGMRISQRSLDLSLRVGTSLFTVLYSTSLFLLVTAPEEITTGLRALMKPLRRFNIPVTEVALTLTLSLRFVPLVLEEFQNLVRSIRTRAINWRKLGWKSSLEIWILVADRLLENLLLRAEQMASAMQVRGFTSPNQHWTPWHQLRLQRWDWWAMGSLVLLWLVRIVWGGASV
jgi:energy-coupling factor transport system permease protein